MLIYGGVKSWSFVGFTLEAKRRALHLSGTAPFEVAYAQDSFENLQLKGDGAWFVTISTQASS